MKLKWRGHACFAITTDHGVTIVTDPFDPEVGYACPTDNADIITISHAHHDHNYTETLTGKKQIIDRAGEYEFMGVKISAVSSFHDEETGKKRGGNLLFAIEADGKRVVHLGDLGHLPDAAQEVFLKNADVMLIPIGGTYTITTGQALEIIQRTNPKTVIPMHFKTDALSFPITDEKEFAEKTGAEYLNANEVILETLPHALILDYK